MTDREPRQMVSYWLGIIHVYQVSPTSPDADIPVCTALTVEYAKQIVEDHNARLREKLEQA